MFLLRLIWFFVHALQARSPMNSFEFAPLNSVVHFTG
jgi:hypothetical protein